MASRENQDVNKKKQGLATKSIGFAVGLVGAYFGSLFMAIVIEWSGIYFEWWTQPGAENARLAVERELNWLNDDFKEMMTPPVEIALLLTKISYEYAIQATGLEWLITKLQGTAIYPYALATAYTIELNAVRLAVIVMSMPALILLGMYAMIDGLVERDLRTWGGGHETSYVYHHAKKFILPMIFLPIIIYLSLPWSIHPSIFVLAFAIPFAISIWLTSMYFKKYL